MLTALVFTLAATQPPPSFPSTAALVGVDVGVVDADGRPIPDLGPDVFSVLIDGRPRRVPWVQWRGAESAGANVATGSFSSNRGVRTGRLVAIVVDQGHLSPGDVRLLRSAVPASGFERLETPTAGPGAAAFVGAAEVPRGAYRLRLAALDSRGLRGSVDHEVSAALASAGELELSDLVITTASGGTLRPDVDPRLGEGTGLAYLELYAPDPARLSAARVTIEIASGEDGPPLASRPARMSPTPEPDRLVAQGTLPADALPAGDYLARAVVCVDGQVVRRVARQFRIER